ncbi:hypothetical protein CHUAL_007665 [Chamberlinius hualienensis]
MASTCSNKRSQNKQLRDHIKPSTVQQQHLFQVQQLSSEHSSAIFIFCNNENFCVDIIHHYCFSNSRPLSWVSKLTTNFHFLF